MRQTAPIQTESEALRKYPERTGTGSGTVIYYATEYCASKTFDSDEVLSQEIVT